MQVHHADAPELRMRLGAVGARPSDDQGSARMVVRLSKLGIRGELGTGLLNLDAERVTLTVEFRLQFTVSFKGEPKGWTVGEGFSLDLRRVESRCDGGLVLTDTGLPMLDLPENVLKMVAQMILPRLVEERLAAALAPEVAGYITDTRQAVHFEGAVAFNGTPCATLDANLCDGGDPLAAAARALAGVASKEEASRLAAALSSWKELGIPLGPDSRKARHCDSARCCHFPCPNSRITNHANSALCALPVRQMHVLGIPTGEANSIEASRVALGDLVRYAARAAPLGRRAALALGVLWDKVLAGRGLQGVSVSAALAAARAQTRKPMRLRVEARGPGTTLPFGRATAASFHTCVRACPAIPHPLAPTPCPAHPSPSLPPHTHRCGTSLRA